MGVFSKALHFLFDSSISEPYAGIYRYIYIYYRLGIRGLNDQYSLFPCLAFDVQEGMNSDT